MPGEHDDLGLGAGVPQTSGGLEAIQAWHAEIQDRHVRRLFLGHVQGLLPIGRLTNNRHAGPFQEEPQGLANQDMIVG